MAAYKRFEMKIMMQKSINHAPNSLDFLLLPPPNMQMNTPFVMSGELMSDGRSKRSNATPFLLRHDSIDQNMDLDCDPTNWNINTNMSKTNTGTSTNDKIVFRTNGVNLTNGYSGTANGLSSVTNDFTSSSKISNNQSKASNGGESTLNAAKRDFFNTNSVTMANGHSGAVNGYSGSTSSAGPSNGQCNAQYQSLFENRTNGSTTNRSVVTNNIFGGQQGHTTNSHQNVTDDRGNKSNADNRALSNKNGINDINTRFDTKNGLFGANNNHSEASNSRKKASNATGFSHLNYNSNDNSRNNVMVVESSQTSRAFGTNKQKSDDVFTDDHSIDADNNGFDDNRSNDDENVNIYADGDDEQSINYDQNDLNDNLKTTVTAKQQTNATNLFGTAQFAINNGDQAANRRFDDFNQQPNGQTNSGNFVKFLCAC